MKPFATFKGPGKSGIRYVFKCKEVTTGRYVKVMIRGAEYLTLAEVQVFSPGKSDIHYKNKKTVKFFNFSLVSEQSCVQLIMCFVL